MSVSVQIETLTQQQKDIISKLNIKPNFTKYGFKAPIKIYKIDNQKQNVIIPFWTAIELFTNDTSDTAKIYRPNNKNKKEHSIFELKVKPEEKQVDVLYEASQILAQTRCLLLKLHCGFGKTYISINLSKNIGLKVAILCHRSIIIKQWEYSITKFTNAIFQKITSKTTELDPKASFYIMNYKTPEKHALDFFDKIGCVIMDEIHVFPTKINSKSMFYFTPKVIIGLSATPTRTDGMHRIIYKYIGNHVISREYNKKFNVYRYTTGITPDIKSTQTGELDWNAVINSISSNQQRNLLIAAFNMYFNNNHILTLTKRKNQAHTINKMLKTKNETAALLIGNVKEYLQTSRCLLATYSKMGTGFDDPELSGLILGADINEGIEQYQGRLRNQNVIPFVIDIVDNFPTLTKHWRTRREWYISHGGTIYMNFNKAFPEFDIFLNDFKSSFTNFDYSD